MTVEFSEGIMIVTHPSGQVDNYSEEDIQSFLNLKQQQKIKIDRDISGLQEMITKINQSLEH